MQTTNDSILNAFKECFEGPAWYGPALMVKLDALPWEKANERVMGSKSIAELVQHMYNWRVFVQRKLKGDAEFDIAMNGSDDWAKVYITDEAGWEALKTSLRQNQEELLQLLKAADHSLLERQVPGKTYVFSALLHGILQHDTYHLGQIALLDSLLNSHD